MANGPSQAPSTGAQRLMEVALSPLCWLLVLQLCLVSALYLVGYLSVPEPAEVLAVVRAAVLVDSPGGAEYRAALAFSGVTLGLTFVLAITSLAWAVSAYLRKGPSFSGDAPPDRRQTILQIVVLATFLVVLLATALAELLKPFPSELGFSLLQWVYAKPDARLSKWVPTLMFLLSLVVPAILAAGASFLQEPIEDSLPAERNRKIALRVRELDHLLYIGAVALVFGTLQLSATMSVPLASVTKAADLKSRIEMCRTFGAVPPSNPLYTKASAKGCLELPALIEKDQAAAGLRQLVRAVTFALGLAFSAMLVAIYVPAMVSLRLMQAHVPPKPEKKNGDPDKSDAGSPGDVDPLQRLATVAATLGPLIAGVVANAFAGG